jgi:hypothetical protein
MMVRLGFAGQADNPPPGIAEQLHDYLRSAQRVLYKKNPSLRTERFYRWTMIPGVRYYGISDNDSQTDFTDITCGKHLNEYSIRWVGLQNLNQAWIPMIQGIDPSYYTTASQEGIPSFYEIRSCIEVFPAPNAAYHLWIKGQFGLEPFTGDSDRTTIDSELVFLLALGRAKKQRGQPDANDILSEAGSYLADTISGKHGLKRYIPGTRPIPPAVQPTLIHFDT